MASIWLKEAIAAESAQTCDPLDGDTTADVCIVGGGFTGLWTAYELKRRDPSLDIVVIEKHVCGAGASGANAGYLVTLWIQLQLLQRVCGLDESLRLCRASETVIDELQTFCKHHHIPAELRRNGAIWGATCEAQSGHWNTMLEVLGQHQVHHFQRLSGEEIQSIAGTESHVAGVLDKSIALVHPGHLIRGLRRVVLEMGVRIFEHTEMASLKRQRPPVVNTPRGSITAHKVVLGLYGWSLGVRELASGVMVIFSDALMSEPVPEQLDALGWRDGPGLMDSRVFVQAQRTTADGRVMWTKAGGALPFGDRLERHTQSTYQSKSQMRKELGAIYPSLAKIPIAGSWAGPIDRTKDGLPYFGALPDCPDVLFGYGYSGSGLILSRLGSQILASLVLGSNDEWSTSGLVRPVARSFPPDPFRYIGAHFVRQAIARKDAFDHLGKPVGPLTRFWLGFKPSSYKPS